MNTIYKYITPFNLSDLLIKIEEDALIGVWFESSPDEGKHIKSDDSQSIMKVINGGVEKGVFYPENNIASESLPQIILETKEWLDTYFLGQSPTFTPKYKIKNATPFRMEVLGELMKIPFGELTTYGEIASTLAKRRGIKKMSAQAVGGAVGWNPIGVIIPCHRVIGKDGSLTGYGGGMDNKVELLKVEGHECLCQIKSMIALE